MPTDSNGNYSLPLGYLAVTGATIQASQHNPPLEDIAVALSGRLSTNGSAPMSAPLKFADGSASLPAMTFQTNPANGLYKTTGGIGVAIGGVKVAEFLPGGVIGARFIGELIPYTCTAAPALTVMPFGQTLNRITYAALWVQAQIEIAAGNTFYNNGNGSTTFGIGDLRGRIPAAWDKMGGVAASRLTTAGSAVDGGTLGAAGGVEAQTLTTAQLPVHSHTGNTGTESANHTHLYNAPTNTPSQTGGGGFPGDAGAGTPTQTGIESASHTHAFTSDATGSGNAHLNVQPTIVTNYILFAGA